MSRFPWWVEDCLSGHVFIRVSLENRNCEIKNCFQGRLNIGERNEMCSWRNLSSNKNQQPAENYNETQ